MNNSTIPDLMMRGSFGFFVALGVFMAICHVVLVTRTAEHSSLGPRVEAAVPLFVGGFAAAWLGLALLTARWPAGSATSDLAIGLAVGFGPMLAAITLLFGAKTMRQINEAMRPDQLIWLQTYRMAGLIFLYPFAFYGAVPRAFAFPAAIGDFITGACAPLVALAVVRRKPHAFTWAVAWNIFGIVDLIVAPAAAVLSSARILENQSLALVPLFLGPPLGILTHVLSLRNLAVRGTAGTSVGRDRREATPVTSAQGFSTP